MGEKSFMQLVLLVGQSNMAGRGDIEDDDMKEIPGLFKLDKNLQWVPAVEPVHFDRQFAGVGPGRTFGRLLLAANPGCTVGLVPCSVGGTALKSWQPGAATTLDEHPYDDTIRRAKIAMNAGSFKAILWHQGETDAEQKNCHYAEDLTTFIEQLRRDLDLADIPFICGEIGRYLVGDYSDYSIINQAIDSVVKALPYTGCVSSEGLLPKADMLHFESASAKELGFRYFEEYLRLADAIKLPVQQDFIQNTNQFSKPKNDIN